MKHLSLISFLSAVISIALSSCQDKDNSSPAYIIPWDTVSGGFAGMPRSGCDSIQICMDDTSAVYYLAFQAEGPSPNYAVKIRHTADGGITSVCSIPINDLSLHTFLCKGKGSYAILPVSIESGREHCFQTADNIIVTRNDSAMYTQPSSDACLSIHIDDGRTLDPVTYSGACISPPCPSNKLLVRGSIPFLWSYVTPLGTPPPTTTCP